MAKDKIKEDSAEKSYWKDNEQFADLFNAYLYQGRQVINPKELAEMDTDISDVVGIGEVKESIRGARDVIKIAKRYNGVEYVLLAVENQEGIHYAMPIRVMGYDQYSYNKQYQERKRYYKNNNIILKGDEFISGIKKTDRFLPVITLVLYYGEDEWNSPRSLHDILDIPPEIKNLVSNYDIKIIDMKKNNLNLNNQNNKDLFKVLSIVYDNGKDRKERGQELAEYEYGRRIDDKVIDVIAATTGVKIDYDKEGERKVCRLWEELREDGRDEGALINLISLCCQKYKKGLPPEVAADHLEQKVEDIKRIYAAIEATNTQDADEIYKYLFGDADR